MAANGKRVRKTRIDRSVKSNTTKQLVVVALLVVVFVFALVTQPTTSESGDLAMPTTQLTGLKPNFEAPPTVMEPHPSLVQVEKLALRELEDWINDSPFAASQTELIANALGDADGSLQVQAVYGHGSDAVALIGRRLVRRGETLPDGRRVISITADGVELAR